MLHVKKNAPESKRELKQFLSPLNVWALAFGCAVGWGAFVMPGTTFLPNAGPLGTVLGILIGAAVMLLLGVNYHYMMNRWPDAGGTYSYSKHAFGYDHGFLSAWFLILVYVAITWANATALPLIFRNLLGDTFQFGFHYRVAGFDVYLGEALLSLFALLLFGVVCIHGGRFAARVQTVMALILIVGVLIGFGAAVRGYNGNLFAVSPGFVPRKMHALAVVNIVALAPWAFSGFESISNSTQEFAFSPRRSLRIMLFAVITSAAAYCFLSLMAVSAPPESYESWVDYIGNLGFLSGLKGLPTFHAVNVYLGKPGLVILGVTVVAGVVTGLVGNYIAASRLIYALAEDDLLPRWFAELNGTNTPKNAILFVMLLSLPIPFLGRTAISWIVDVNTIGATIAYAYTSAAAYRRAQDEHSGLYRLTGGVGMVVSVLFFLYFMVPNLWSASALSAESYLILIAWSILGFGFFRYIYLRDTHRRLGKSTVVWIVLLFLIFFASMMWVRQSTRSTTREVLEDLNAYNERELAEYGVEMNEQERADSEYYLEQRMEIVNASLGRSGMIQTILIMAALFIMFSLYNSMMQREREMESRKIEAEQRNRAKSVFLSNMSHDIRTPMNAIIGYTALAKKVEGVPAEEMEFLDKIESSSEHLLALINDVLEMSRIESGKMELEVERTDLLKTLDEVRDLFAAQMQAKHITYTVEAEHIVNRMVLCDRNRFNRVLLNLISNACKFTPDGGQVNVTLTQSDSLEAAGRYELRVRDTGVGMSPEFAERVFDAYSRERTASSIQGTGLGMAITKNIVDLMQGTIEVETEPGKGTEFLVRLYFPFAPEANEEELRQTEELAKNDLDFSTMKLLLVDDNEINREIATMLLEDMGFAIDTAENGQLALDAVAASRPGEYRAVLMDIQMPVMNGYEAARAIRALPDEALASVPIIAMSANAFAEDVQEAHNAGMNAHIAKPIDVKKMTDTLTEVLRR